MTNAPKPHPTVEKVRFILACHPRIESGTIIRGTTRTTHIVHHMARGVSFMDNSDRLFPVLSIVDHNETGAFHYDGTMSTFDPPLTENIKAALDDLYNEAVDAVRQAVAASEVVA
jgi:hypothetical protein